LITSSAGAFHIQPNSNTGCLIAVGTGICLQNGAPATSADDRNLRFDNSSSNLSVMPEVKRMNVFMTGNYRLTDDVTAFGELGVYKAKSDTFRAPVATTSAQVITAPTTSYYNPFGPTTFGGVANPNRLPGTTAPTTGLAVTLTSYDFVDAGLSQVNVKNDQYRVLMGLKGDLFGFKWETAAFYNEAEAKDVSDRHQRHSRPTPDRPVHRQRL